MAPAAQELNIIPIRSRAERKDTCGINAAAEFSGRVRSRLRAEIISILHRTDLDTIEKETGIRAQSKNAASHRTFGASMPFISEKSGGNICFCQRASYA